MKKFLKWFLIVLVLVVLVLAGTSFYAFVHIKFSEPAPKTLKNREVNLSKYSHFSDGNTVNEFNGFKKNKVNDLEEPLKGHALKILDLINNSSKETEEIELMLSTEDKNKLVDSINDTYFIPKDFEDKIMYVNFRFGMDKIYDKNAYKLDIKTLKENLNKATIFRERIDEITKKVLKEGMCEKEIILRINNAVCDYIKNSNNQGDIIEALQTGNGNWVTMYTMFKALCYHAGLQPTTIIGTNSSGHDVRFFRFELTSEYTTGNINPGYIDPIKNNFTDNLYTLTDRLWDGYTVLFELK